MRSHVSHHHSAFSHSAGLTRVPTTRLFPANTWAFPRLAGRPRLLGAAAFALFSLSELGCGERWMTCALPACCERSWPAAELAGETITVATVFSGFCVSREALSIACARAPGRGHTLKLQVRRRPEVRGYDHWLAGLEYTNTRMRSNPVKQRQLQVPKGCRQESRDTPVGPVQPTFVRDGYAHLQVYHWTQPGPARGQAASSSLRMLQVKNPSPRLARAGQRGERTCSHAGDMLALLREVS